MLFCSLLQYISSTYDSGSNVVSAFNFYVGKPMQHTAGYVEVTGIDVTLLCGTEHGSPSPLRSYHMYAGEKIVLPGESDWLVHQQCSVSSSFEVSL